MTPEQKALLEGIVRYMDLGLDYPHNPASERDAAIRAALSEVERLRKDTAAQVIGAVDEVRALVAADLASVRARLKEADGLLASAEWVDGKCPWCLARKGGINYVHFPACPYAAYLASRAPQPTTEETTP